MKISIIQEGLSEKFYPNNEKGNRFFEFGKSFGEKISLYRIQSCICLVNEKKGKMFSKIINIPFGNNTKGIN